MINLILISHGTLASGLREAAEMIVGDQSQLEVFGVFPGNTVESFAEKIEKAIQQFHDPENTLILSDIPCGTPANTALMMVMKHHVHALSGCNLPLLIEVLSLRTEVGMEELLKTACESGKAGIVNAEEIIAERLGSK